MGIGSQSQTFGTFFDLALLVAGCTKVGPDYVRPETAVSQTWLEAGDKRVKTEPAEYRDWWKAFNDPTLDRLIDSAYRENLTLRIAGVRVLAARAQLGIATGQLYPQTQQATGSVLKERESAGTPIAGTGVSSPRFGGLSLWESQVGLTASWEIDFWGKFRRAIESADASLLASIANYDSTLVSLTGERGEFLYHPQDRGKAVEYCPTATWQPSGKVWRSPRRALRVEPPPSGTWIRPRQS